MGLIDKYTTDELTDIVNNSYSLREVIYKLGYSTGSGSNNTTLKKRLEKDNIDTSHFSHTKRTKRCPENIFIKDSTATQKVLRDYFLKGNYVPYKCSICGLEPIWQGKALTLILDHINGHNKDDRLENLRWVCPNCNQQLDTTGSKNFKNLKTERHKNDTKVQKIKKCIDCGKFISINADRCNECYVKYKESLSMITNVSREELKTLIRNYSFLRIGKMYGISDNAIRKWCIKYNLPKRKTEIKSYSDEEWELI